MRVVEIGVMFMVLSKKVILSIERHETVYQIPTPESQMI